MGGTTVTVKVAHVRLCHSRMMFVRAYPRETQEMVFDAHDRAFAFFRGACTRGIYDNMKTAVDAIFVGKERAYNRRFWQMCSHDLVEPAACTPASGWEKGQVENQVGLVRERFFSPRLRVKSYNELNAWLLDKCVAHARAHRHPEQRGQTVWQVFEAERLSPVRYAGRFDGFHAVAASVSKTCLVRFDHNRYSVAEAPLADRLRSAPMRIGLNCARMVMLSATIAAASDATRRCSIPGTTCRFCCASRAHCATARRSRTGCCPPDWSGSAASWLDLRTATDRWLPFWPPCSVTALRRWKQLVWKR